MQQMTKGREPFPESDFADHHASHPTAAVKIAINCKLSDTLRLPSSYCLDLDCACQSDASLHLLFYRDSVFNCALLLSGGHGDSPGLTIETWASGSVDYIRN